MNPPRSSNTLAAPLYPARAGDPDRLYQLLPADLRRRDQLGDQVLQAVLQIAGSQYDLLEADILQLYDDVSIETCRPEFLSYIGDLLGFVIPRAAANVEVGSAANTARASRQATLMRRLIGTLITSRRRKGTISELRRSVKQFGDPSSFVVETLFRIERTPAVRRPINFPLKPSEFSPTVRENRGYASPFAWLPLTPEVRRVVTQTDVTPGRAHPDGIEIHLGRLRSFPVVKSPAYDVQMDDDTYLLLGTFDPLGGSLPLLTRALEDPGPGEAIGPAHFVYPIDRRVMATRLLDYYGPGKSIEVSVDGQPWPAQQVAVADLAGENGKWKIPELALKCGKLLLDPQRGRLALRRTPGGDQGLPASSSSDAPSPTSAGPNTSGQNTSTAVAPNIPVFRESSRFAVSYFTGIIGNIGGGYARRLREIAPGELYVRVVQPGAEVPPVVSTEPVTQTFATLDEAVTWFRGQPAGERVVIELTDSQTYFWKWDEIVIPEGTRLTIRAASGVWPLIWCRDTIADSSERVRFTSGGPGARLVLEGLRFAGRALHLENDLRTSIRDTTLIPNWISVGSPADMARSNSASLTIHGVQAGVSIDRSILGRIQVDPDQLTDPLPLVIRDSFVDAGSDDQMALVGPNKHLGADELPHAYVVLILRNTTVFGRIKVHQIALAIDSLLTGVCESARRQSGCVRFCYLPLESTTPARYRCQPDLARATLRRQLRASTCSKTPQPNDSPAQLDGVSQRVRPRFASRKYGEPTYGALHESTASEIRTGAEDGGEMGAFHDLDLPIRDLELLDRLAELVPAGLDYRLIIHPRNVL